MLEDMEGTAFEGTLEQEHISMLSVKNKTIRLKTIIYDIGRKYIVSEIIYLPSYLLTTSYQESGNAIIVTFYSKHFPRQLH